MWVTLVKYIGYPLASMLTEKLIDAIQEAFANEEISDKFKEVANKKKRRIALMNSIKGAKTNEDRKELSILLHNHNLNKLPK
jgi:hypothetical protein